MGSSFFDLTPEKQREAMRRLSARRREADRADAPLFAYQLAQRAQEEATAEDIVRLSLASATTGTILLFRRGSSSVPLDLPRAAGVPEFPEKQRLPSEWFDGDTVTLHFNRDSSGIWHVERYGTMDTLVLRFWSSDGARVGDEIRVTGTPVVLPVTRLSEFAVLEVAKVEDDDLDV